MVQMLVVLVLGAVLGWAVWRARQRRQQRFLETYRFRQALKDRLHARYPRLSSDQVEQVFDQLREFFLICQSEGGAYVSMPSKIVDDAWHEFILFTADYRAFCQHAFGRYLDHHPVVIDDGKVRGVAGITGVQRTWRAACSRQGIDPYSPTALPLLFMMDDALGLEDGCHYTLETHPFIAAPAPPSAWQSTGGCGGGTESGGDAGCGGGCGGD